MTTEQEDSWAALRLRLAAQIAEQERNPEMAEVIGVRDGMQAILRLLDNIELDERAGDMESVAAKLAVVQQITCEWLETALGFLDVVTGRADQTNRIREDQRDGYPFGACPTCGDMEIVHVGRIQFGACEEHRVFWPVGSNLLSAWRDMTDEQFAANARFLKTCKQVEPAYWRSEVANPPPRLA